MGGGVYWGVLFSIFLLFVLFRILPSTGKSALILNIHGFQTPLHGVIPWREVGGINLQQITFRGRTTNTLHFYVPNYAQLVKKIHWTERILGFFGLGAIKRKIISILVDGASEDPEVIYAISRLLWKKNTGMSHEWYPTLSSEYNQATRRVNEFMSRYKDPNASSKEILSNPEKALDEIEQFNLDMKAIKSERQNLTRKFNWLVLVIILIIIATLVWLFVKSHI